MQTITDHTQFRKVMARFVTGVTVVTTRVGDEVHGMTCNAFCSISISPLTVMVSLAKNTRSERLIGMGGVFAVNVLSETQSYLSDRFAGRHKDKEGNRFEGFEWASAVTGAPIFTGIQAYLDCKVMKAHNGGTHTLYLGEVVASHVNDFQRPLLFYQSRYMGLDSLKAV
ncbi:MAG: flavin reductase family protein [Acidobacteria bacterium]|nr:flavin reductase family protein [Acidobacteriota bacterium]MCI0721453.1 flavin reductase family protein [Acidobacteriota bacterium]